jgi:hypothetical protein
MAISHWRQHRGGLAGSSLGLNDADECFLTAETGRISTVRGWSAPPTRDGARWQCQFPGAGLLPLELVHNGFLDAHGDAILPSDRRLILWSRCGAPRTLLLDEVRLECHISGLFATLAVLMVDGSASYSRTVRVEHVHPLTELVNAFIADGRVWTSFARGTCRRPRVRHRLGVPAARAA